MRIYQLIRGLSARYDVTCLTFAPDAAAEQALAPLRDICRVHTVCGPPRRSMARRALTTVASRLPDMALRNASAAYADALIRLLADDSFAVVQAESIEMAGYLRIADQAARSSSGRVRPHVILDQFNAEYMLQKRAAITALRGLIQPTTISKPRALVSGLVGGSYSLAQWFKLARYERRVMRQCDALLAVSEDDRRMLLRLHPGARIAIVPNGVDTAYFSRAAIEEVRAGPLALNAETLVFSGTLDFRANVDALEWFVREVLPLIRARRPGVRLLAVGRRPAPALQALARAGTLLLTGEVVDARPYLASAAAYIVPMRIGGGVRLKLLEALALEAPTVSTSMGAEGIDGLCSGEHCLLADTPEAFAGAVLRLLEEPAVGRRLGAAGRALVGASYDWSKILPRLDALYAELIRS
jgi:glycosyltransferase involved in cell wall biosynthesis